MPITMINRASFVREVEALKREAHEGYGKYLSERLQGSWSSIRTRLEEEFKSGKIMRDIKATTVPQHTRFSQAGPIWFRLEITLSQPTHSGDQASLVRHHIDSWLTDHLGGIFSSYFEEGKLYIRW